MIRERDQLTDIPTLFPEGAMMTNAHEYRKG